MEDIDYKDILYTPDDVTIDYIIQKFIRYIFTKKDNDKLNFSSYLTQTEPDFFIYYKKFFEKNNVSIAFQNINEELYFEISCGDDEIIDYINSFFEFENFSYWDKVDPDENVSAVEWEKRKEVWKQWHQKPFNYSIFNFYNDWITYKN